MGTKGSIMRKKVIVRAPALTQSGYGEHSRFVLRALRSREDLFDIYLEPLAWGHTAWVSKSTEENDWMNKIIQKSALYVRQNPVFDMSIQVTIPNEWEKIAPVNIGITAGIESTRVSPVWLEKANIMDKIVVVSEHAKYGFDATSYTKTHKQTGHQVKLVNNTPIKVVGYPVRDFDNVDLDIDFKHDFNYLVMAQWGPRKNLENTIRWFIEENYDEEVGLVVKTSIRNGSRADRTETEKRLSRLINEYKDRTCSVYLIHGTMDPEEISSLYQHPKIKAFISLTHGEGFGLPIFEAAYNSLPIVTTGWGGQCDYLYVGEGKKKKGLFADVNYSIAPIQPAAHWDGVLEKESSWCYPDQGSYKMKLRQVRKNYDKWKKRAKKLERNIRNSFGPETQYEKLVESLIQESSNDKEVDQLFDALVTGKSA